MWATPARLQAKGVVGMNRRNIRYIGRYNDRRLYPLVDDKLQTKLLAKRHGITTPDLIGTVSTQFDVKHIVEMIKNAPGFVIKPAKGSGGKGILVVDRQQDGGYIKPSGTRIERVDLERHVSNILSGLYSLGGTPRCRRDRVFDRLRRSLRRVYLRRRARYPRHHFSRVSGHGDDASFHGGVGW